MKNTQLIAGFVYILLSSIIYTLGYTQFVYQVGNSQMLIYPAAGFALLGVVLIYRAVSNTLKTP